MAKKDDKKEAKQEKTAKAESYDNYYKRHDVKPLNKPSLAVAEDSEIVFAEADDNENAFTTENLTEELTENLTEELKETETAFFTAHH